MQNVLYVILALVLSVAFAPQQCSQQRQAASPQSLEFPPSPAEPQIPAQPEPARCYVEVPCR